MATTLGHPVIRHEEEHLHVAGEDARLNHTERDIHRMSFMHVAEALIILCGLTIGALAIALIFAF